MTAFFIGEDLTDDVQDSLSLIRNLERYLQPYVREEDNATADPDVFFDPGKGCADCSACFALYPAEDASMNREDFNELQERAAAKWDSTILFLEAAKGAERRAALMEALREELNKD